MSNTSISISLPTEMAAMLDDLGQKDHRSRSEVVQEALRVYLGIVEPTIPPWQEQILAAETRAFQADPDQEGISSEALLHRLRTSRSQQ